MKLAARSPHEVQQDRRERWLRDRSAAQTLRRAFPAVEQIRIDLNFMDRAPHVPAGQGHTLNPPAQAFFRFLCPCADCNGEFDLQPTVSALLDRSGRTTSGRLECHGVRARDRATGRQCALILNYKVSTTYAAAAKAETAASGRRGSQ